MVDGVDQFQGKRVCITGGAGFIGSNLAKRLVAIGAKDVTIIDSMIPEFGGNLFNIRDIENKVQFELSDVRDFHSMKTLIRGKDYLFNLAGQTSHIDAMADPLTDMEINAKAQLSILEVCRHENPDVKIVFASTRQIYGRPSYLPVDEKHLLEPVDVNGINKASGEKYHILYNDVYGVRTCALRLTNTYGPCMRIRDARQTFLGVWIRQLLEDVPFEVWGGTQRRDFNYVDDVVDALLVVALSDKADGEVFNLGGEDSISLKQLASLLVSINGSGQFKFCRFPKDREKIDIGDYYADTRKIRNTLDWKASISLEDGLRRTLCYYWKNLEHYL